MNNVTAVILAAGQGTRMKSQRAKVLHELAGRSLLHHVLTAAFEAGAKDALVVVGFDADNVRASLASFGDRVRTALQPEQRGTGHAVECALAEVPASAEHLLILCGDTPLIQSADLERLMKAMDPSDASQVLSLLTCKVTDPTGYGRIVRDGSGAVLAIREHRDCSEAERAIDEINPAMYAARASFVREAVKQLKPNNAQGELYFTDVVAQAAALKGAKAVLAEDASTLVGINDRAQLFAAEEVMYQSITDRLRKSGVTIRGDARVDAGVVVEQDVVLERGVVLRGATVVRKGAFIDVGCVLTDVVVAEGAKLQPYSVATKSSVGSKAHIGPFSHLRPDSEIGDEAHVGNFVETKKTVLRKGAKANHLAYLGDGDIGEGANIGAGTIFCNYDGFRKHKTEIGPGAFVGSDSQIIAPVKIGAGAYVATGTTVTKDVPDDALAIARLKQENKEGYASKLKARLKAGSGK
ncbi:MAG: bifunctional UDP-N-acetylglucosamine diphosphorylase/glucosamine-1-phosphate N-acetyltransferase GlmU [Polyangiaceae bacterium]|nr:bifunctional UDP-N-acetylglucosamine diphosphorylase/glucosamine-1-phosphate N-acetyltransferase GlmU [Polyangiaceae bacterium]